MSKIVKSDIVDGAGDSYLRIYLRLPQFVLSPLDLRERIEFRYEALAPLLLYLLAALFGVHGNWLEAHEPKALWLAAAFCLWLLAELVANKESLRDWVASLDDDGRRLWLARALLAALWLRGLLLLVQSLTAESALRPLQESALWFGAGAAGWLLLNAWYRRRGLDYGGYVRNADADTLARSMRAWLLPIDWRLPWARGFWLVLAVFSSLTVWQNTSGNQIQPAIMGLWFASALFWSLVFAPRGWGPIKWARGQLDAYRAVPKSRRRLVMLALLGIFALGASFRLTQIDTLPPEMVGNADHRGPIVAAYKITQGQWPVMMLDFQPQEPMHYYLVAAFAKLTGVSINFTTLKLVSALESLILLPIMFWLGVELAGRERRKFGLALGLMACALVAASFWHVIVVRSATRVNLIAPYAALTLIYLARAMRNNRRSDFVLLGLTLGFAWYSYTASRALPLAVAAGIGLTLLLRPISLRERLRYLVHAAIAGLVFCVVALPWIHFAIENPWMSNQQIAVGVFYLLPGESLELNLAAFTNQLLTNFRTALLIFNFTGDFASVQALPHKPTLDPYTGAFLILGLAALVTRILKARHDPVWWLLPLFILIMLLPTTLQIVHPVQVASNTRTMGVLPAIYFLAALPVAMLAGQLAGSLPRRLGMTVAALFCFALTLLVYQYNTSIYFNDIAALHKDPHYSFRHIGKTMRGLVDSGLPWGNIRIVHSRGFEFDTRNPYIEAGVPDPGFSAASVIQDLVSRLDSARNRSDRYRLDANADVVFLYYLQDEETPRQLMQWFPNGYEIEIRDAEYMSEGYMLFRAPAPGEARLNEIIALYAQ